MPVHYNKNFKKEVVKTYMPSNKSTVQISADYNIAKSTVSQLINQYKEGCFHTTSTTSESNEAKEIRRLNQLLNDKDKEIALKKSSGILREGNQLVIYGFMDDNKNIFGLRWLCQWFGISSNCYYNNNHVISYMAMRIFIKHYGYEVSNITMHKYMNKELQLYIQSQVTKLVRRIKYLIIS